MVYVHIHVSCKLQLIIVLHSASLQCSFPLVQILSALLFLCNKQIDTINISTIIILYGETA